jgi:hypothetical protein
LCERVDFFPQRAELVLAECLPHIVIRDRCIQRRKHGFGRIGEPFLVPEVRDVQVEPGRVRGSQGGLLVVDALAEKSEITNDVVDASMGRILHQVVQAAGNHLGKPRLLHFPARLRPGLVELVECEVRRSLGWCRRLLVTGLAGSLGEGRATAEDAQQKQRHES